MTGASIVDLAILGIASDGPIEADRIAAVAKALVPEHWQPTASVIAAVIERNLVTGHLRRTGNHIRDEHITVTAQGGEKIRSLLLCPPEALAPSAQPAAEAIQLCFLDVTDAQTAQSVLSRYRNRLKTRLETFARRSAQCPHVGRFKTFWIDMEQRRLQSMVQFLAGVAEDPGAGEGQHRADRTQ